MIEQNRSMSSTAVPAVERRRHTRYELSAPVTLYRFTSAGVRIVPGLSVEISYGGLAAVFPENLPLTEAVEIQIEFPPFGPVRLPAVIKHRTGFRYRLQFGKLSREQLGQLLQLCAGLKTDRGWGWILKA